MKSFEVLDRGGTTQVEQVFAGPEIASPSALSRGDMGKGVFNGDTLPKLGTACWTSLQSTEPSLAGLVSGNRDRSTSSRGGLRAVGA